jgi:hypothetical protein
MATSSNGPTVNGHATMYHHSKIAHFIGKVIVHHSFDPIILPLVSVAPGFISLLCLGR